MSVATIEEVLGSDASVRLAIEMEQANMARHRAEQKILVGRYHPDHQAQFISSLAVREEIHSRRLAALYAQLEA